MTDLRADNLIKRTAEKLKLSEELVRYVVTSFFQDSLKYYLFRPTFAKGHIDLAPYFQIRASAPKLRYILSYKTYSKRVMVVCAQLYKILKTYGKRQTGFKDEHARLIESALERTRLAINAGTVRGLDNDKREFSLRRLFPTEIDEIQRKYFDPRPEVQDTDS